MRYWNNKKLPPPRPPNPIFIYSIMFEEEVFRRGINFDRTTVSQLSLHSWPHENDIVKSHYARLAIAAKKIHNQIYEEFQSSI